MLTLLVLDKSKDDPVNEENSKNEDDLKNEDNSEIKITLKMKTTVGGYFSWLKFHLKRFSHQLCYFQLCSIFFWRIVYSIYDESGDECASLTSNIL